MFEQEIELEKRQSSAVPLLIIVALIVTLVGITVYFLMESRRVVTPKEAAQVATQILNNQGPTTVSFHTGVLGERFDESPRDARYRLLEKAGVVKIAKDRGDKMRVTLTPHGDELLKQIPGVKHSTEADGRDAYVVPLATRQLAGVSGITMSGPERATITYSWRWAPNALGESFDASGGKLSDFNSYDRVALIDKFGARFYQEPPTSVTVTIAKAAQGWQVATE
jgi:hypothetical protein